MAEGKRVVVDERRALPRGIRFGSRCARDHRRLANEARVPRCEMRAIAVEAGATVGETFRALFENWGTVIPLGEYPGIGMGGHVVGGAFGFLCRELRSRGRLSVRSRSRHGERSRARAQIVVATREPSDPNRELWWAHTGGGGGNFGIVTRYWFRSHDASGDDPSRLLPRAPESVTTFKTEWSWSDLDRVVISAVAAESRTLVRAECRRRFAVRVADDAARDPYQGIRQDLSSRREHRRRAGRDSTGTHTSRR